MDIYLEKLAQQQINSHYFNRYCKFISYCSIRTTTETYLEKHHILPKSLGGDNSPENLISLTAREHFLAHWMLWKAVGGKMAYAFHLMCSFNKESTRSSHVYAALILEVNKLRSELAKGKSIMISSITGEVKAISKTSQEYMSGEYSAYFVGERNWAYGRKLSQERIEQLRLANKDKATVRDPNTGKCFKISIFDKDYIGGKYESHVAGDRNPFKGKKHTDEAKSKMGVNKGKVFGPETRAKISESMTGELNHFFGKHHTDETKETLRLASSGENNAWHGKMWIYEISTNSTTRIPKTEQIPEGWARGRPMKRDEFGKFCPNQ